jgi:hypothetical protein
MKQRGAKAHSHPLLIVPEAGDGKKRGCIVLQTRRWLRTIGVTVAQSLIHRHGLLPAAVINRRTKGRGWQMAGGSANLSKSA